MYGKPVGPYTHAVNAHLKIVTDKA